MKKKIPLPISFAAIWILFRLVIFNLGINSQLKIGFLINVLFILILILTSLHVYVKREKKIESFAVNFKNSLKQAGIYLMIVVGFIFIFHQFINPEFLTDFHERKMEVERDQDFTEIIKQGFSKEEYLEKAEKSSLIITSKKMITTFYFGALFLISIIYSVLAPLFYKKVVLRI